MKLKENTDVITFLNRVKTCSSDVFLETAEGDQINLQSVLSQYVFVVMCEREGLIEQSNITCSEEDYRVLSDFLEE